jgi:hypothetical protein
VINRKDPGALDELVAEDLLKQVPLPGQGPGREGLRDVLVAFFTAGDFLGIPATGRPVRIWGVVIDRFSNGLFAESRILMDMPALLVKHAYCRRAAVWT